MNTALSTPANGTEVSKPVADDHVQTLSELIADIHKMENMVLYYENRILRKRMAIAEILNDTECHAISDLEPAPTPSRNQPTRGIPKPTVLQMLKTVLPAMNGSTFRHRELAKVMVHKYPEHSGKIQRGVRRACRELYRRGTLIKVATGLSKNAVAR